MGADRALIALALLQALAGARVAARLLRRGDGSRIARAEVAPPGESVSVVVPVLNERARLGPCLDGLIAQGAEVAEILVVDGGSVDGTPALAGEYAARDARVRLVDASPVPPDWNGKAWGLHVGWRCSAAASRWLLTIDADVRPDPALARSLLAHARRAGARALSVATAQEIDGIGQGLLHPALLTTLVYRFGPPGRAVRRVCEVQANGQCFLVERALLDRIGGFAAARASRCEDVTLARQLASTGCPVGFYEADGLVYVKMHEDWRETWANWPRSLPMRDRLCPWASLVGLTEVTLAQALPLPLVALLAARRGPGLALALNAGLALLRLGALAGTARAYRRRPAAYWASPLADAPVALALWSSVARRRHVWRGRVLVSGGS